MGVTVKHVYSDEDRGYVQQVFKEVSRTSWLQGKAPWSCPHIAFGLNEPALSCTHNGDDEHVSSMRAIALWCYQALIGCGHLLCPFHGILLPGTWSLQHLPIPVVVMYVERLNAEDLDASGSSVQCSSRHKEALPSLVAEARCFCLEWVWATSTYASLTHAYVQPSKKFGKGISSPPPLRRGSLCPHKYWIEDVGQY